MNSLEDLGFDASRFYLGSLCRFGHKWRDTEQSLRSLSNGKCRECRRSSSQSAIAESRQQQRRQQKQQLEAIQSRGANLSIGELFYLGVLCKKGHDYQGTGGSLRRRINKSCVECEREKHIENRKNPAYIQRHAEYARRHHQNNRESRRAKARDWYLANRDRKQAKAKEWMKANRDRFRKYYQSYQQQNRDKINQYLDEYRKTEQGRLVAQKRRIRRRARKAENHSSDYSHGDLRDRLQVFGGLCSYCLSSRGTSIDHFIPVSRGGSDALGNLLPCCKSCNSSKHNADPLEWYSRQSFFDRRQWLKILRLLGKSEGTYTQIPLL